MDSLSDHTSRRSTRGRRPSRGPVGAAAVINRALLLTGALLFINGISITLIAAFIPFAINSAIVISVVTILTASSGFVYLTRRNPDRTRALVAVARPLVDSLSNRDQLRRQGGL
jgi:hypothetical protein